MSRHRPSFDEFCRCSVGRSCVPVYRQLTGDGLTPVSAFRRIERSAPSFLFESVIGGEKVGRFSFLGTEPFLRFEARGLEVSDHGDRASRSRRAGSPRAIRSSTREAARAVSRGARSGLASLRRRRGRLRVLRRRALHREPAQRPARRSGPARPVVRLLRPDGDLRPHSQDDPGRGPGASSGRAPTPKAAYESACGRIDELVERLAAPGPDLGLRDIDTDSPVTLRPRSNFTRDAIRGGRPPLPGIHQGRRHLPGRSQPAVRDRDDGPAVRHLPGAAGGQSQPVPVLPALSAILP